MPRKITVLDYILTVTMSSLIKHGTFVVQGTSKTGRTDSQSSTEMERERIQTRKLKKLQQPVKQKQTQ